MKNQDIDDGSLKCLNIPKNINDKSFNCDRVNQKQLANTSFWVIDFLEEIPTRFSKLNHTDGQTLVKIKFDLNDPDYKAKKFFTGSADILYVLQYIRELDKFPRKVTLRNFGHKYYFE